MQTKKRKNFNQFAKARNQARNATRRAIRAYERKIAYDVRTNPKQFRAWPNMKIETRQAISVLETPGKQIAWDDMKTSTSSINWELRKWPTKM